MQRLGNHVRAVGIRTSLGIDAEYVAVRTAKDLGTFGAYQKTKPVKSERNPNMPAGDCRQLPNQPSTGSSAVRSGRS